jgi:hypothetical protein
MVGDRGVITSARIWALKQSTGLSWITCLRAPAIRKLAATDGRRQLSLSGQQDPAEITSPEFPGERLVACRNPLLAAESARKGEALLAATETLLTQVAAQAAAWHIRVSTIGVRAGRVINTHEVGRHIILGTGEDRLSWRRDQAGFEARPPWTASTSSARRARPISSMP